MTHVFDDRLARALDRSTWKKGPVFFRWPHSASVYGVCIGGVHAGNVERVRYRWLCAWFDARGMYDGSKDAIFKTRAEAASEIKIQTAKWRRRRY